MKHNLQKLIQLEENYNKISEGNKIIKDGTHMYLLNKMKREFNTLKIKYLEKKEQIEEIRNECVKINNKINIEKKELENIEEKLYNKCGSNVKLIEKYEIEVKKHKLVVKEMEDSWMELLEKEEALKAEKEKIRQQLSSIKNSFDNYKEGVTNKLREAKIKVGEGEKAIDILKNEIPKEILLEYNSIKKCKDKVIVPVKNGVCSGCKIRLSSMTISKLNKSKEVVYCDNCERIVYLPQK
ncbi:zinc ribbon domain-containing protein [Clostridium ganghwense]|uniref:C4-type zinc ribbon domain-containing protein n=1 Tax=Clostridium ganghwense TaxID=312089 RepID=A0ABT4CRY1_9CLOT|nr:C4-type zinc ribbon domain-containing protein [Clostridium ganghwense]MCY6371799.1 C4-type zinc ribbon domain-containing protein [Clostridium ganghwense]